MKCKQILSVFMSLLLILCALPLFLPTAKAAEYDERNATVFTFSDSEITADDGSYTGYKIKGTALTISSAGTYIIKGSCSDGSVTVKKGTTGVTLVLSGLDLTSSDTAPIACNKSTEVTIIAADGTENTLTDSEMNNDETYTDNANAENAVIKCKDGSTVTVCGTGSITINANGKNGIKSGASTEAEGEASLTIKEVTLDITAVNDAINAEQLLNIESGNITVSAGDDGIHCDLVMNIGVLGGDVPVINIKKSCEGIEAASITVNAGDISVLSEDDCMNAANSDRTGYAFDITIAGGTLSMYSTSGDGIDSNGTLTVSGGFTQVFTANSADNEPLDADGTVSITGGTVLAAGGSAGMGIKLTSSQSYISYGSSGMGGMGGFGGGQQSSRISAGSTVTVSDSSGNTLVSASVPCSVSYLIFSSPEMTSGEKYTLSSNGSALSALTAQTGSSTDGRQPGGNDFPNGGNGTNAAGFFEKLIAFIKMIFEKIKSLFSGTAA